MPKSIHTSLTEKKTAKKKTKTTRTHKTGATKPVASKKEAGQTTSVSKKTVSPKTVVSKKVSSPKPSGAEHNYTEEYADYLERYELYGEGRPRLSPKEFESLDEEILDLLALESDNGVLEDEQIIRLQELEYLLLDSEQ